MPHVFCIINDLILDKNTPKVIVSAIISPQGDETFPIKRKDYSVLITGFEDNNLLYEKVNQHIITDLAGEYQIPENQITIHIY